MTEAEAVPLAAALFIVALFLGLIAWPIVLTLRVIFSRPSVGDILKKVEALYDDRDHDAWTS